MHSEQPPFCTYVPGSQRQSPAEVLPAGEDEAVGQAEQLPLPATANVLAGHTHTVAPVIQTRGLNKFVRMNRRVRLL